MIANKDFKNSPKFYAYGLTSDNMSIWRLKCFAYLDYMGDKEDCQVISVTSEFIHKLEVTIARKMLPHPQGIKGSMHNSLNKRLFI
jgi:hypothetical protein